VLCLLHTALLVLFGGAARNLRAIFAGQEAAAARFGRLHGKAAGA